VSVSTTSFDKVFVEAQLRLEPDGPTNGVPLLMAMWHADESLAHRSTATTFVSSCSIGTDLTASPTKRPGHS
jgi:hypothetical protein